MTTAVVQGGFCLSCGAELGGEYCSACGQERLRADHDTMRELVREALITVSPADSRALRSFRDLVLRPGELTRAYMDGRRKFYMSAVQLFLVSNLVFFVIGGIAHSHMFTTPLYSQLTQQLHSIPAQRMVLKKLGVTQTTSIDDIVNTPAYRNYETRFNVVSQQTARALIILMVPLLALVVAALEHRRGRAAHHVVFALHFYAFALLLYLTTYVITFFVLYPLGVHVSDGVLGMTAFGLHTVYLCFALGRAYGEGRIARVVKGSIAGLAAIYIIFFYRFLLFFVAFYEV